MLLIDVESVFIAQHIAFRLHTHQFTRCANALGRSQRVSRVCSRNVLTVFDDVPLNVNPFIRVNQGNMGSLWFTHRMIVLYRYYFFV